MQVTNIKIKHITPNKGHIAFVSCILDGWLFINNIAIFTRLEDPKRIRLVFPEKKIGETKIRLFHPVDSKSYFDLEEAIASTLQL